MRLPENDRIVSFARFRTEKEDNIQVYTKRKECNKIFSYRVGGGSSGRLCNKEDSAMEQKGTFSVKAGLAQMLKGASLWTLLPRNKPK
jgi:hypothetical protein